MGKNKEEKEYNKTVKNLKKMYEKMSKLLGSDQAEVFVDGILKKGLQEGHITRIEYANLYSDVFEKEGVFYE